MGTTNPRVVIRRYGNRRLYDTTASRYINLEEIARLVREGREIQVLDNRTGEDLTRVILTQIIVEEAREQKSGLPLQVLHDIVIASEGAAHDLLGWYLDAARQLRQKAQDTLQSRLSEARHAVTNPLAFMRQLVPGFPSPPGSEDDVEQLRARIEELERQLAGRTTAGKRRKRPGKAGLRP
jgi:polyhydroxyalkanoate synthesis repressor PhaR